MSHRRDVFWQYAPVWVMLFSTSAALIKVTGERYLLQREWEVKWTDVGAAAAGALVGYLSFRFKHGQQKPGLLTR